jgi:DNA-binding phage protein
MQPKLKEIMRKQRYNCSSLARDAGLNRWAVAKIVKNAREAKLPEVIAISKTLNLKINSINDLEEIFLP